MKNRKAKFKYGRHYHPRYVKDEMGELEWVEMLEMGDVDAPWSGGERLSYRSRWDLSYHGRWYCSRNDDKLCLLMRALKKERRKHGR